MALSPVNDATRFIIDLNQKRGCSRVVGLGLCARLIEWIAVPNHSDHDEAATLVFFFAKRLEKERLISSAEMSDVFSKAALVLSRTNINAVLANLLGELGFTVKASQTIIAEPPVDDIIDQFLALREKDVQASAAEGKKLFERLIQWLAVSDPENGAVTTVFTMAMELQQRGCIDEAEKDLMFNRAFQVIVRLPGHKIKDKDQVEFLRARGFKL